MVEFNWCMTLQGHLTVNGRTPQVSICTTPINTLHTLRSAPRCQWATVHEGSPPEGRVRGAGMQAPEVCWPTESQVKRSNHAVDRSGRPLGRLPSVLYFLSFPLQRFLVNFYSYSKASLRLSFCLCPSVEFLFVRRRELRLLQTCAGTFHHQEQNQ